MSASMIPEAGDRLAAMFAVCAWLAGCWLACWACRGRGERGGDQ
jgi:hypothetical protein